MASQEEKVEEQAAETTPVQDTAEFSGAWDDIEAKETGQPAPAAGRPGDQGGDADQGGDGAGQGEAEAGQPDAGTTPGADAGTKPPSRDEISDDVLANADPTLKAHIAHLDEERRQAQRLARSNGGRLAQALNELSALKQSLGPKAEGATEGGAQAATKDEKMELLQRDYPEVAEPILEHMAKLEKRIETLTTGEVARAEAAVVDALGQNMELLKARHPDLPTIVADPAYKEWVTAQSPAIQRIVQDNSQAVVNAEDAALVFDLFKQSRGQADPAASEATRAAAAKREAQLDAGRTATGGTQPGVRSDARQEGGTYDASWDDLELKDQQKAAARRR